MDNVVLKPLPKNVNSNQEIQGPNHTTRTLDPLQQLPKNFFDFLFYGKKILKIVGDKTVKMCLFFNSLHFSLSISAKIR